MNRKVIRAKDSNWCTCTPGVPHMYGSRICKYETTGKKKQPGKLSVVVDNKSRAAGEREEN